MGLASHIQSEGARKGWGKTGSDTCRSHPGGYGMTDYVVIGGGIVGSSATYRLARSGLSVTLVDRGDDGYATAAGAGIISPGTSFRPPPPFYPLAAAAVAYYPHLLDHLAEDGEGDTGYDTPGAIFVASTEEEAARLPQLQHRAEERLAQGVPGIGSVTALSGKEAKELFPALADVPAAFSVSGSSRVNGRLMQAALQRAARKRGANVVHGRAELAVEGDTLTHVMVDG